MIKRLSKIFPDISFDENNYIEQLKKWYEEYQITNPLMNTEFGFCIKNNIPIYNRETGDML
jgi:hypothetical protein